MAKLKLSKGELKKQRDALKRYERFLPTLQLKKQQLQMEILRQRGLLAERKHQELLKRKALEMWAGLLAETSVDIKPWLVPQRISTTTLNIAGIDFPSFGSVDFSPTEYDLFLTPLWVDHALDELRALVILRVEISILEKGIEILQHELRVTTQRVNLFEKVKIPDAQNAIRLIKIYIGDQMVNAVGRSKIAKRKAEESLLQGAV